VKWQSVTVSEHNNLVGPSEKYVVRLQVR